MRDPSGISCPRTARANDDQSMTTLLLHILRRVGLVLALCPNLLAAADTWSVQGLEFTFEAAVFREGLKVQGFARHDEEPSLDLVLRFGEDDWTLLHDEALLSAGTFTPKGKRKVVLHIGESNDAHVLVRHEALLQTWAAEAGLGLAAPELAVTRARWRIVLRRIPGTETVQARLTGQLATQGTTAVQALSQGAGVRVRSRAKALSVPVPLALLDGSPLPPPPVADFAMGATSGVAPFTVGFASTSSGSITAWEWTFGDGDLAEGSMVSHTFLEPDEHAVTLTVTGPGGTDSHTRSVFVLEPPLPLQTLRLAWDFNDADVAAAPFLTVQSSPFTSGSVAFNAGDTLWFDRVLSLATNGSTTYGIRLHLDTNVVFDELTVHVLEVGLLHERPGNESVWLVPPFLVEADGPTLVQLVTDNGPPLHALPGDRVALMLRNTSPPDPGLSAAVDVLMGISRVTLAGH